MDLEKFIIKEYYIHNITTPYKEEDYLEEIDALYKEDIAVFDNSSIYVAKDTSGIIGSVKVTLWNDRTILPIEKLFGINVKKLAERMEYRYIWHVGRFAITKNNGMLLLKKLLVMAISTICIEKSSLMLAECDKKLVKGLNLMGINTEILAPSIFYLGSETLPIYSTYEWLKRFLIQETAALPLENISISKAV